ncbi:type III pantothenate kinase [Neisseriaceae bacterium TC5R-5]|nr:type III pantothenate kinase [Neisseriaceae bacterium TC5R-5]
MKLFIDAGNSRVKWAVHDGERWQAQGAVEHAAISSLASTWQTWPISVAWAASVARPEIGIALTAAAPCPLNWVNAQTQFGSVRNHYHNPAEQGADRWLAILAARELCAGDVIVACAGTALTVEALTAEGDYLGGLIVPGVTLMLSSLAQNTAKLDRVAGKVTHFPQNTPDALASGAFYALSGAIETQRQHLAQHTGRDSPPVLLTGGDATSLAPWLAAPVKIVDNLILMGLLQVANK